MTDVKNENLQVITLQEMVHRIKKDKKILIFSTIFFLFASLIYVVITPKIYMANSVLFYVSENGDQDGLGASGMLSAASSLSGLNLGGGESSSKAIAIFTSNSLLLKLVNSENLLPDLFPDEWDDEQQQWKKTGVASKTISLVLGRNAAPTKEPSTQQILTEFREHISMEENDLTGLVELGVRWTNPAKAKRISEILIENGNDFMRQKRFTEADHKITVLQEELGNSSLNVISDTIGRLIEIEMAMKVKASTKSDFAFEVIDEAVLPTIPYSPRVGVIVVLSLIFGVMVGLGIIALRIVVGKMN